MTTDESSVIKTLIGEILKFDHYSVRGCKFFAQPHEIDIHDIDESRISLSQRLDNGLYAIGYKVALGKFVPLRVRWMENCPLQNCRYFHGKEKFHLIWNAICHIVEERCSTAEFFDPLDYKKESFYTNIDGRLLINMPDFNMFDMHNIKNVTFLAVRDINTYNDNKCTIL